MAGKPSIVRDVYWCVWTYRSLFLRRSLPAFLLYLAAGLIAMMGRPYPIVFIAYLPATLIFSRILASWHRFVISGAEPTGSPLALDQSDVRFFLAVVGLAVLAEMPDLVIAIFPLPIMLLLPVALIPMVVALVWLTARSAFIFPLIALGEPDAFRAGWLLGRGNAMRVFWALLFASLPILLATILMMAGSLALVELKIWGVELILAVLSAALMIPSGIVYATLFSRLFLLRTNPAV